MGSVSLQCPPACLGCWSVRLCTGGWGGPSSGSQGPLAPGLSFWQRSLCPIADVGSAKGGSFFLSL